MIGYPGVESKPILRAAHKSAHGALPDDQDESIKLAAFATNNLLPDLLCVPLLSVPVGAGPRGLLATKSPEMPECGRMT